MASAIQLPELPPWNESDPEGLLLTVATAGYPHDEGRPAGFYTEADGGTSLLLPDTALFSIGARGDRVTIHPVENADPLRLTAFLLGSVLAILCYKRGLFPLHGSCVLRGERAVVFAGPIGAGKSTLAAALALRGNPLLCDDVCAIDLGDPSIPLVWPAFPRVRLLADAIAGLQLGKASTYSKASLGTKGHFGIAELALEERFTRPFPISAIYGLGADAAPGISRTPLQARDAVALVDSETYRPHMGARLGFSGRLFEQACAIADAVPVFRLERPRDLGAIGETARLIEEWHPGGA